MKPFLYFLSKWPLKNSSTAQNTFFSLMSSFQQHQYQPFVISQSPHDPEQLKDLSEYAMQAVSVKPNESFKLPYQKSDVQLAIYDSPETSRRFSYDMYNRYNKVLQVLMLRGIRRVQELSKGEWRKEGGKQLIKRGMQMWPNGFDLLKQPEGEAILRADIVLIQSQFLYYHLKYRCNLDNVVYSCEYLPTETFREELQSRDFRPWNRRKNFYFIGDTLLPHNRDCLENLLSIWPLIHSQLPEQQLHIFSRHYPQQILQRKRELSSLNVTLFPQIEDIEAISKYRMLLAPYSYHVDSPGKILEAWFYHTPVVTTPFGSQSLFLELPEMSLLKSTRFLNEKAELTEEEERMEKEVRRYYEGNKVGDEERYDLNFGGLWKNYTKEEFVESVMRMCKEQKVWERCRRMGGQILVANHSDERHFRKVLGAMAAAEYRRAVNRDNEKERVKKEAWDKYLTSFAKQRKQKKRVR